MGVTRARRRGVSEPRVRYHSAAVSSNAGLRTPLARLSIAREIASGGESMATSEQVLLATETETVVSRRWLPDPSFADLTPATSSP